MTDAADCTGTDQRGVPWPNPCDIGATHATAAATVPDAPTSLMAMKGNSQVTLSWTAPLSDGGSAILGYDILEGTTPDGESTTPVVTGASGTSYTVTGLTNGTTYYFTVEAVNALGNSAASNESSAKPATFGAATSLYVNSATDTGATDCTVSINTDCGIDDAIIAFDDDTTSGADADTIVFSPSIATFTVGTPTAIDNTTPGVTLAIDGNGQSATAVSGNNANSVFDILGGTVTISGLTVENGIANGCCGYGGGIANNAGSTLTVTDSTVSDNGSGGIFNDGTSLTVTDSTVSDNSGGLGYGSGIWSGPGGTSAVTSLTVTDSTVSDNSGGGISNDPGSTATVTGSTLSGNSHSAAISNAGTLTVTGSTLSGNNVGQNSGGGIWNENGATATVTDSTVSDNSGAAYGSGILNEGALSVVHSTLSGNNSFVGGGGSRQRARPPSSPPSWLGTRGELRCQRRKWKSPGDDHRRRLQPRRRRVVRPQQRQRLVL